MEVRWKASFSASCLHAVLCREQGFAACDVELGEFVDEPGTLLVSAIEDAGLQLIPALVALGSLGSEFDNNRELTTIALNRLYGAGTAKEQAVSQIAAAIGVLETKLLAARPEMVDELALRGKPLQQQWQARGPGLLKEMARLTAESFVPSFGEVVLVTPWAGGYGRADAKTNRVIFEAVLADPHADLPEALRLGWLLGQLNSDLPVYSESVVSDRFAEFAALAALPAVLAAAEVVEWGTCTEASVQRAIECWHVPTDSPAALAERLWQWWQTYREGTSSWEVAWRALESLLG